MSQALLIALVITLEPLPIVGFILTLSTARGARNGAAFIAGWLVCLVAIVAATVALTGGEPLKTSTAPATGGLIATILIGLGLLWLAWRHYRHPSTGPPKEPGWMKRMDQLKAPGAALLGVALQPWPLVAAGAIAAAELGADNGRHVATLAAFCLLACGSLLIMEGYALMRPQESRDSLARLRAWIEGHRDQTITVLSLVIGIVLVVQGAWGLATAS